MRNHIATHCVGNHSRHDGASLEPRVDLGDIVRNLRVVWRVLGVEMAFSPLSSLKPEHWDICRHGLLRVTCDNCENSGEDRHSPQCSGQLLPL